MHCNISVVSDGVIVRLDSVVVERRTRDREVAGSSLTHCAVEYGPWAHLPLSQVTLRS